MNNNGDRGKNIETTVQGLGFRDLGCCSRNIMGIQ